MYKLFIRSFMFMLTLQLFSLGYSDVANCDQPLSMMNRMEQLVCQKREDFRQQLMAQFKGSPQIGSEPLYTKKQALDSSKLDFFSHRPNQIARAITPLNNETKSDANQPRLTQNTSVVSPEHHPDLVKVPLINFF